MSNPILAWHFLPDDRRLANGDGRPVTPGSRLTVDGPVVMCSHGLHASVRAIDALQFSSGSIICRVIAGAGGAREARVDQAVQHPEHAVAEEFVCRPGGGQVTTQLTWAQRARNWSLRCSATLPGCPWTMRLLERKSDRDIERDVLLVQSGLIGAIAEHRSQALAGGIANDSRVVELLELTREAETLLFQFEHRGR